MKKQTFKFFRRCKITTIFSYSKIIFKKNDTFFKINLSFCVFYLVFGGKMLLRCYFLLAKCVFKKVRVRKESKKYPKFCLFETNVLPLQLKYFNINFHNHEN